MYLYYIIRNDNIDFNLNVTQLKKKKKTMSNKKSEIKANVSAVFNMEDALKALEATPAKVQSRETSGLSKNIIDCITSAGKPLAINQIVAMLNAGGVEVTSKKVSDRAWLLAKNGKLVKTELGVYGLPE